ncbi:MAG TPA: SDR family NAD(P)-dependent oxidoreductase [Povalibacter sp.]|nr:SDR family NAD(P)-dependent oxidoreductase [Povalibacter sp.]
MATQAHPLARSSTRPLAIVTGASSGIGRELAIIAAQEGFDLIVAADEPLAEVCVELQSHGAQVTAVEADLSTLEGVDRLCEAAEGLQIDALFANAGHGLGHAFLDQQFEDIVHVVDTNITGTLYLLHRVGNRMRARGEGKILITGSIAGFMPGSFQAVYNGTKAFIDSFALALRDELHDSGVTVTCLMPGPTDTGFFERAEMLDTKVATDRKDDPWEVARLGFRAAMNGEADIVTGLKNRLQVAAAHLTPSQTLAKQHRKLAEPGSAAS